MTKVLVIGLDGATLDLIEPWAADGPVPVAATSSLQPADGLRVRTERRAPASAPWAGPA